MCLRPQGCIFRSITKNAHLKGLRIERNNVTYQHLARYMCSLTKTEPDSRMYQQQATLSGLQHSNTTAVWKKNTHNLAPVGVPQLLWDQHRKAHTSAVIHSLFSLQVFSHRGQSSQDRERNFVPLWVFIFLSCWLETKSVNQSINESSCFTRLHNSMTTAVVEEVEQFHCHCTVRSSRS